jgi:hypothetical protein
MLGYRAMCIADMNLQSGGVREFITGALIMKDVLTKYSTGSCDL